MVDDLITATQYDIEEQDNTLFTHESDSEEVIVERIVQMYTKPATIYSDSSSTSIKLEGDEDEDLEQIHTLSSFTAYRFSYLLTIIYVLLSVVSLGFLLLVSFWWPALRTYMTHWKCKKKELNKATCVVLKSKVSGEVTVCSIRELSFYVNKKMIAVRVYVYRHVCYIYDRSVNAFVRIK
jgi:transcription elongation factor Elf1